MKTVNTREVSNAVMVAGNERHAALNRIVHDGKVKQWVGIGWVSERDATPADIATLLNATDDGPAYRDIVTAEQVAAMDETAGLRNLQTYGLSLGD